MNEKYWVWLSSLNKITPRRRYQLIKYFTGPEILWTASKEDLTKIPFITREIIEHLTDKEQRAAADGNLERLKSLGIDIVTIDDELYPDYLKHIYDPPVVLYIKGRLVKDENVIAVVGSRNASGYGLGMAERLSYELAERGITVISGMARGIDTSAHNGALKADGRTIAVLGCGLDIIYPEENRGLMKEITDKGAVISEYLPGTPPAPFNFPARNRIISGTSLGVVVVEANNRSGSLITAHFALDQGREVFAVPGNVGSLNSIGTNKLIKDGAKMVTGIDDILEELKIYKNAKNNNYSVPGNTGWIVDTLDSEEKKILECLFLESMHMDLIVRKTGLCIQNVNSMLVMMELKGMVEQMPGKIFRLKE